MKQMKKDGYVLFIVTSMMLIAISAGILLVLDMDDRLRDTYRWIAYYAIAIMVSVLTGWVFTSYFIIRALRRHLLLNHSTAPDHTPEKGLKDHVISLQEPTSLEESVEEDLKNDRGVVSLQEPITPDHQMDLDEDRVLALQIQSMPDQMVQKELEEDRVVALQIPALPDQMGEEEFEEDTVVVLQIPPVQDQRVEEDRVVALQIPSVQDQRVEEDRVVALQIPSVQDQRVEEDRVVVLQIPSMADQIVEEDLEEHRVLDLQILSMLDQMAEEDLEDLILQIKASMPDPQMVGKELEEDRVVASQQPITEYQMVEKDLEEDKVESTTPDRHIETLQESITTYEMEKELDDSDGSRSQKDSEENKASTDLPREH